MGHGEIPATTQSDSTRRDIPDQDMVFQEKQWRVQRVAWVGLLAFLIAAVLGALGRGWLSERSVAVGPAKVRYEAIARRDAPIRLAIEIVQPNGGYVRIGVSDRTMEQLELNWLQPIPSRVEHRGDRTIAVFGSTVGVPFTVSLRGVPGSAGRVPLEVEVDGAVLTRTLWVLP